MFLPGNQEALKKEEKERKAAYKRIEEWSMDIIPAELRKDASISVQEIQCGDPECAPIDTAVTIFFESGCNGMFGLPMEAKEVTDEDLRVSFPTRDVLEKWQKGEDAEWPPVVDPSSMQMPELRFDVGTKVFCRIGPDATKDWAPGSVIKLWYRENNWPPGSFAPYQIKLDDGRSVFAPGDIDQVIKKQPEWFRQGQSASKYVALENVTVV
eukprot:scaffold3857_cov127-Cylindrotheca_fusiformis.AAC.11